MAEKEDSSDSDGPIIDDNVIRIQLRKSNQKKWELRTRNHSPGIRFPTIQLFDSEGNLLVETNDENISIRSHDSCEPSLKTSQSMNEKDYKHVINRKIVRKHNSISGDKIYTRVYHNPVVINKNCENTKPSIIIKNSSSITNIPSKLTVNNFTNLQTNSLETTPFHSEGPSEVSSYKSSDNETCEDFTSNDKLSNCKTTLLENDIDSTQISQQTSTISLDEPSEANDEVVDDNEKCLGLQTSQSLNDARLSERAKAFQCHTLPRSKSNVIYKLPQNKVSFLNTYLRSLPARPISNPNWLTSHLRQTTASPQNSRDETKPRISPVFYSENSWRNCKIDENFTTDNDFNNIPTDVAADCEMKKRLKMYRRGISEIEPWQRNESTFTRKRRHSVSGAVRIKRTSSSESVDEADVVLNRLKRRILKNKLREKRRSGGNKTFIDQNACKTSDSDTQEDWRDAGGGALLRSRLAMGSNISQHSAKGLKGRRARSSGDLCNGEAKSQTESSVCGSVVGDSMGWNRSLPNHLDGNRHLAEYSRVNNNYGEFGTYNRCHTKSGRGLRYRVTKSGSNAEPVWKLQDPGFDQGYGSERSPEEDFVPPIVPAISLEQYEAELRAVYTFITDENTFTVVVEKDGRGLGMSVCGGGGLVRIRRLYPPQPAWRTGRLAPKDLLLSANGVPLAGLSTYEALEVLRTASARVELRVCRPPSDVLESITPPDPPTPPARTPHPPHLPLDPLNCHPLHARLSQTTSSATTSSSEGRGRREASPDDRRAHDLHLPDLDRPLPVYDIQYGEFDIVMTKVNGSLGFTLRKEDHSALGHYVRALVREPALSDGRIQPGDRIVAVNDTPMSNMSHAEAVAFLRSCGSEVRLRLYRDHAATPLSPMSPKEEGPTDSDGPINKPKPPLRAEAVSMLCDLAARRLTPDAGDGSRSPCLSPRKHRKLTKDNNHYEQPNDLPSCNVTLESQHTKRIETFKRSQTIECSSEMSGRERSGTIERRSTMARSASIGSTVIEPRAMEPRAIEPRAMEPRAIEPRAVESCYIECPDCPAVEEAKRPRAVVLVSPTAPPTCRKQKLSLTVPPHGYELNNLDNDTLDAPNVYQEDITLQRFSEPAFPVDSDEPVSMPAELSSDERFKHSNPTYLSAVLHTTTSESASDGHKDDGNGLKKWKGVALSPENERKVKPFPVETQPVLADIDTAQKENIKPETPVEASSTEPTIVTVELNRGWNSRLGFSVQSHPDSGQSYISAVYSDSVAARDGRLRRGDVILQVNDENVTSMKTPEVIDLLRILRGSICITVLRPPSVQ
ncbi:uncharacterized protein LOC112047259 isoform X2 [Bicyclus anynana]|uniref:Uncharacterized protein LOC112047259 isoform X2 n=1 Tax=Bicyclus anynana TaxID=110368 RepID=A0ABM3LJT7_BICAN|nr:uncharacterized protein LOC112047259 isoform X2 [Bicyclus anynana]